MAFDFGFASVIDNFNRSEDPLSTNWTQLGTDDAYADGADLRFHGTDGALISVVRRTDDPSSADHGAYVELSAVETHDDQYLVVVVRCVRSPQVDNYPCILWKASGTWTITVQKQINDSYVGDVIGPVTTLVGGTVQAGDAIGITVEGENSARVRLWHRRSGTWYLIATGIDQTDDIPAAGRLEVHSWSGAEWKVGALYGGALPAIPAVGAATPSLLSVHPVNGRLAINREGRPVLLTGTYNWPNLANSEPGYPWEDYLDFAQARGYTLLRLGPTEPYVADVNGPYAYLRTGPGTAADGGPKFDLSQFDSDYFDTLRRRVIEAGNAGLYVLVCLWQGWSLQDNGEGNPWPRQPFNSANNINSIDGDYYDSDGNGEETRETRSGTMYESILSLNRAYAAKVIDTVGDLENVLWEISNEDPESSEGSTWTESMIDYIRAVEAVRPRQHLIARSSAMSRTSNASLFAGGADIVCPGQTGSDDYAADPPASSGAKIVLVDGDHCLASDATALWAWKCFVRTVNVMDIDRRPYSLGYADLDAFEDILGYADRMVLALAVPNGALCSTGYCLAWPGQQYLALQPGSGAFTVTFAAAGRYKYEWFDTAAGSVYASGVVSVGSGAVEFTPPTADCRVLFLSHAGEPALLVW